ncbi:MAG TPA: phosphate transport system regulatory protein PhoU [Lachnoclostridium phytofermentans]|uniref:Phosphate-specific transport system accessory protein PhoU n=1 Tax=Lachnoclostridium phytofermentans TaxID=66219 RepID=A0A3D2X5V6_9FIRM|nr:phosphate signaling complex protein PhoU [Lachnoclostridium sp.]HCL02492.1 phosphate transport system regulatory protein PhoU [Lachnoclostridium phytofermentans]
MAPRVSFEYELTILNNNLRDMGTLIESAIDKVIKAFENEDETLATEIIQGDRTINDMERVIESRCLSLILRQQPVAKDLRIVTTALKVVTDMERIGDHAADISELILRNIKQNTYSIVSAIPKMAQVAKEMVHDAVDAFISCNTEAARTTIKKDDIVDDLFNEVKSTVIEAMKNSGENADSYIDVLMIAKYMERIGDHAVNICEWTEFHETGSLNNVRIL